MAILVELRHSVTFKEPKYIVCKISGIELNIEILRNKKTNLKLRSVLYVWFDVSQILGEI